MKLLVLFTVLLIDHLICVSSESGVEGWNEKNHVVDFGFSSPLTSWTEQSLLESGLLVHHHEMCLMNGNKASHCINHVKYMTDDDRNSASHQTNNTFWINEYMHIGHVTYDLVLLQLLALNKLDRIISQRSACYGTLCWGIGTFDSFFKGFYLFALEAFFPNINSHTSLNVSQSDSGDRTFLPVYLRWNARDSQVHPMLLSSKYIDTNYENQELAKSYSPITLQHRMCFDSVYRRGDKGFFGSIDPHNTRKFKETAHRIVNEYINIKGVDVPDSFRIAYQQRVDSSGAIALTARNDKKVLSGIPSFINTKLSSTGPFEILIAYRGPGASRYLTNLHDELAAVVESHFPSPLYVVHRLNTTDNKLSFQQQIATIANNHVVVTNHGAYESNVMYMHNSSLLLEIGGDYDTQAFLQYQHMAKMFGVFYGRVHVSNLTSHGDSSAVMRRVEMNIVVDMIKQYFHTKAYSLDT
jgi:hypothetical protein